MEVDANWYPDPTGRHAQRWWDGQRWTGQVADSGQVGIDMDQVPAGWHIDEHQQTRWWDGTAWAQPAEVGAAEADPPDVDQPELWARNSGRIIVGTAILFLLVGLLSIRDSTDRRTATFETPELTSTTTATTTPGALDQGG